MDDLPEEIELPAVAKRQVRAIRTGHMQVDAGLIESLAALQPPIAFLDFESVFPAIPRWAGCGPYTHVPVQLSCHTEESGQVRHVDWLADGLGDPRLDFARALIAGCSSAQSVVVYNISYERACIRHLAEAVPQLATALREIESRLVDLLPMVSSFVYHPGFARQL